VTPQSWEEKTELVSQGRRGRAREGGVVFKNPQEFKILTEIKGVQRLPQAWGMVQIRVR
jgi:hypothetical protein